jgi:hypothetical protein
MIVHTFILEQVCDSGTTLWNSGKDGKEKRMVESTIWKCMTTVQVEDTMTGPESCG